MRRAILASVVALGACTATSNPDRDELVPVEPVPKMDVLEGDVAQAPTKPEVAPAPAASPTTAQEPAPAEPAAPQTRDAPRELALGSVGGHVITPQVYLRRLWGADSRRARDVLEQIVFAELATLEADRLGVSLDPAAVESAFAKARATLEKKLADSGSKLTLEEHISRVLEAEPKRYLEDLRFETIVQMLAERCVRAWTLESERAKVRLTEVREATALEAAKRDLEAGKTFAEIALAHGRGDDAETHTTSMILARAESQELSRLVFATAVGTVGGPIEQSGRWLYFTVDERIPGREGGWAALGEDVERGLAGDPVKNLEFLQWRAVMTRRYKVDLGAFFDLVEGKSP